MIKLFKKKYYNKYDLAIDTLLDNINWYTLLIQNWEVYPRYNVAIDHIIKLKEKTSNIKSIWKADNQKSLAQILIMMDLLPNGVFDNTDWYFDDALDILNQMSERTAQYTIWGSHFTKAGKLRKNIRYQLVSDLSTLHIKRILASKLLIRSRRDRIIFENELKNRENKSNK